MSKLLPTKLFTAFSPCFTFLFFSSSFSSAPPSSSSLLSFQVLFIKVVKKLRSLSVEEQLIFNARVGAVEFNEDFFIIFPARKALYNVVFVNKDKANIAAVRVSKHRRSYDVYWTYHCYCAPLSTYIYLS